MSEKKSFHESMREISNVILTRDVNTDFSFSSAENDQNAEIKNGLKKKKLYFILLVLWAFVMVVIVGAENILLLLRHSTNYFVVAVTTLIGILLFVPVGWKWHNLNKNTKSKYDKDIMIKAVQEILPGAECKPDGHINADLLYFMGIIPAYSYAHGSYLISYNKNGHICHFSNLSLDYRISRGDKKDKVRTIFTGQAYVLQYKSNLQGCVRIAALSKSPVGREILNDYRPRNKAQEKKVETENIHFNNNFEVFATDEHMAFYVLTPYVMEQLLLMKQHFGSFGVVISADEIAIALNTGYYLFEMPRDYKEIDKISVENSKKKLCEMLKLAQEIENAINGIV